MIPIRDIARASTKERAEVSLRDRIGDASRCIGRSRAGRAIEAFTFGSGPKRISLIAGAHADEPVGPCTLLALCAWIVANPEASTELGKRATWSICPHVNPDGAHKNSVWTSCAVDAPEHQSLEHCLRHFHREAPGDDVEFGFPDGSDRDVRPENLAVSQFLAEGGPFDFHASLHGMHVAEGAWFLLNRERADESAAFQRRIVDWTEKLNVPLHDWDRNGEKGFQRIARGFCTTPTQAAMREHFLALEDPTTAARFRASSMDFVRSLGGNPLCMVSEMPLFHVKPSPADAPRLGDHFLRVKDALPDAVVHLLADNAAPLRALQDEFGLEPFDQATASQLQLTMILLGAEIITPSELEEQGLG